MSDAAGALSRLTGREVRIDSARTFAVAEREQARLPDGEQSVGVGFQVVGEGASMFLLLKEEDARRMLGLLLGEAAQAHPLSELEISALEEVGNILASARLNAVGATAKMSLLPSVPNLACGTASALLARALGDAAEAGATLAIETPFRVGSLCSGSFFLFAGPAFLAALCGPDPV